MTVVIVILVIIAVALILALINKSLAEKDLKALKAPGDLIEIRPGEYLHALSMGEGKYTIIMLSGLGTPCPCMDFKPLAEKLSEFCRVIILELPGYGFSSLTEAPRNAENYDKEISACLDHFGIKENVILMPHSYSGIMTFDYAIKHPDVIVGLCNDDASSPQQWKLWENRPKPRDPKIIKMMVQGFLFKYFGRLFMRKQTALFTVGLTDAEDKKMAVACAFANYDNKVIKAEDEGLKAMSKALFGRKYPEDLHVLNMVANKDGEISDMMKKYTGLNWKEMHDELISNPAIQKTVEIENAEHYIHHTHAERMAELAKEFVESLG